MLKISAVPCFDDNYIWVLQQGRDAIAVDPGAAAPLRAFLERHELTLKAILITHRHNDHLGGVAELTSASPVAVYGPTGLAGISQAVSEGSHISLLGLDFEVWAIPGHTREHLAYRTPEALFCGDTLFSAGCGRVFDNTWAEMHASLVRIAKLPDATRLYPSHEYTQANLRFAQAVEPDNATIAARITEVTQLRASDQSTLPTTVAAEKNCNPFLRTREPAVIAAVRMQGGEADSGLETFCSLRRWKDQFR